MENIPVTAYSGFSNVRGEITLRKVIENITKGVHAKLVFKIRLLVSQGKTEEANNVKKQLPFYTVTAGYSEKRQAYSITRYTHVILLDIDDQPEEKLEDLREKINKDPNTLGSFLTPKAHGFKIFVFLQTEDATTLRETFSNGEKDFAALEKYHRMMYDTCKEYYEKLLDVEVDGSGKDISRGFFTSFDEKAYLNEELMKEVDEILTGIVPPEKPQTGRKKSGKAMSESDKVVSDKAVSDRVISDKAEAEPWERMEFNKAVLAVKRIAKFEAGTASYSLWETNVMQKHWKRAWQFVWLRKISAVKGSMWLCPYTMHTSIPTRRRKQPSIIRKRSRTLSTKYSTS